MLAVPVIYSVMPPAFLLLAVALGAPMLPLAVRWYGEPEPLPSRRRMFVVAVLMALTQAVGFWVISPLSPWPYWGGACVVVVCAAAVVGLGLGGDLLDGLLLLIAAWACAGAAACGVALASLAIR